MPLAFTAAYGMSFSPKNLPDLGRAGNVNEQRFARRCHGDNARSCTQAAIAVDLDPDDALGVADESAQPLAAPLGL